MAAGIVVDEADGAIVVDVEIGEIVLTEETVSVAYVDAGAQPPAGPPGQPGASAYELDGGDADWGSLTAWLAALRSGASPVLTFQIRGSSSFTASHGLPYQPRIWLIDASGSAVDTDTVYAPGQVTVVFPGPFTGTLQLG